MDSNYQRNLISSDNGSGYHLPSHLLDLSPTSNPHQRSTSIASPLSLSQQQHPPPSTSTSSSTTPFTRHQDSPTSPPICRPPIQRRFPRRNNSGPHSQRSGSTSSARSPPHLNLHLPSTTRGLRGRRSTSPRQSQSDRRPSSPHLQRGSQQTQTLARGRVSRLGRSQDPSTYSIIEEDPREGERLGRIQEGRHQQQDIQSLYSSLVNSTAGSRSNQIPGSSIPIPIPIPPIPPRRSSRLSQSNQQREEEEIPSITSSLIEPQPQSESITNNPTTTNANITTTSAEDSLRRSLASVLQGRRVRPRRRLSLDPVLRREEQEEEEVISEGEFEDLNQIGNRNQPRVQQRNQYSHQHQRQYQHQHFDSWDPVIRIPTPLTPGSRPTGRASIQPRQSNLNPNPNSNQPSDTRFRPTSGLPERAVGGNPSIRSTATSTENRSILVGGIPIDSSTLRPTAFRTVPPRPPSSTSSSRFGNSFLNLNNRNRRLASASTGVRRTRNSGIQEVLRERGLDSATRARISDLGLSGSGLRRTNSGDNQSTCSRITTRSQSRRERKGKGRQNDRSPSPTSSGSRSGSPSLDTNTLSFEKILADSTKMVKVDIPTGPLGWNLEIVMDSGLTAKDASLRELEMHGGPKNGTRYSLPGHVVITINNLPQSDHHNSALSSSSSSSSSSASSWAPPKLTGMSTSNSAMSSHSSRMSMSGNNNNNGGKDQDIVSLAAMMGLSGKEREIKGLDIIFEGKAEFFDDEGRYEALRLIQVKQSLLLEDAKPIILATPQDSNTHYTKFSIPFDLRIPGWLPVSHESDNSATSYGIIAMGVLGWNSELQFNHLELGTSKGEILAVKGAGKAKASKPVPIPHTRNGSSGSGYNSHKLLTGLGPRISRSFANTLNSMGGSTSWSSSQTTKSSSAWETIRVFRHRVFPVGSIAIPPVNAVGEYHSSLIDERPAGSKFEGPERSFTLRPAVDSPSPVECTVTTPEFCDVDSSTVRVSLRLRARRNPMKKILHAGVGAAPDFAAVDGDVDMDENDEGDHRGPITRARRGAMDAGQAAAAAAAVPDAFPPPYSLFAAPPAPVEAQPMEPEIMNVEELGVTRMIELGMEVEESEKLQSIPVQQFMAAYPVPDNQPNVHNPNDPNAFLSPQSKHYRPSRGNLPTAPFRMEKNRMLMLDDNDNPRSFRFEGEGLELSSSWRKVNVLIPMHGSKTRIQNKPREETENPYVKIKHKLKIRVICRSTNQPGQDTIVCLTVPIRFSTRPPPRLLPIRYLTGLDSLPFTIALSSVSLPAYTQLFHDNGRTKYYDEQMPIYKSREGPPAFEELEGIFTVKAEPNATPLQEPMELDGDPSADLADAPGRPKLLASAPQQEEEDEQDDRSAMDTSEDHGTLGGFGSVPVPRSTPFAFDSTPASSFGTIPSAGSSVSGFSNDLVRGGASLRLGIGAANAASTSSLQDVLAAAQRKTTPRQASHLRE